MVTFRYIRNVESSSFQPLLKLFWRKIYFTDLAGREKDGQLQVGSEGGGEVRVGGLTPEPGLVVCLGRSEGVDID